MFFHEQNLGHEAEPPANHEIFDFKRGSNEVASDVFGEMWNAKLT